jgi:hypothetical protein
MKSINSSVIIAEPAKENNGPEVLSIWHKGASRKAVSLNGLSGFYLTRGPVPVSYFSGAKMTLRMSAIERGFWC